MVHWKDFFFSTLTEEITKWLGYLCFSLLKWGELNPYSAYSLQEIQSAGSPNICVNIFLIKTLGFLTNGVWVIFFSFFLFFSVFNNAQFWELKELAVNLLMGKSTLWQWSKGLWCLQSHSEYACSDVHINCHLFQWQEARNKWCMGICFQMLTQGADSHP